jgi:hypothetical protein
MRFILVVDCGQRGYTFVAEARTIEQPLVSGAWRMRLIGSLSPLPSPRQADVNSSFITKDFRDYYVPNNNKIIFRSGTFLCVCVCVCYLVAFPKE